MRIIPVRSTNRLENNKSFSYNIHKETSEKAARPKNQPPQQDTMIKQCLVDFCCLVAMADGTISEKERGAIEKMCELERISSEQFSARSKVTRQRDGKSVVDDIVVFLRTLPRPVQINIVAWASVIANCDGFMSSEEFSLLYHMYHDTLGIEQKEIMERQRELNREVFSSGAATFGIRVNS